MKGLALYAEIDRAAPDDLVRTHAPLVKRIAYHLIGRLPSCVQVDDLIQAGLIGLMDAARHYDASQGASFETYAGIRIRGAMLDEIRRNDWVPRSVHRKARAAAQAMRGIEQAHGRDAEASEVAAAMGVNLSEYHQILQDASACKLFSLDDDESGHVSDSLSDDRPGPLEALEDQDAKREIAQAINGLPERERLVLALYYDEDLNLREIGEVLNVTESRVCQIHAQALMRLRARLGGGN